MVEGIIKNLQIRVSGFKEKCIFSTKRRLKIKLNDQEYYFEKGNSLYKMGLYKEALESFNCAIKLNPTFLKAYHSRAVTKYKLCFYNSALIDYKIILKSDPSDERAFKNRNIIKSRLQTSN